MSALAIVLLLVMLARASGGGGSRDDAPPVRRPPELPYTPEPAPAPVAKQAAKVTPPPWPQATPAGLPPFGPAGWQPDVPPPLEVQARASQLLPQLWKYGPGTLKTEKTAARWITYQAQPMGKKKGVVAFRIRDDIVQNQPPAPVDMSTPMV